MYKNGQVYGIRDARTGVFKLGGAEAPYTPPYQTFSQHGNEHGQMQPIFPAANSQNSGPNGKYFFYNLADNTPNHMMQSSGNPNHQNSMGIGSEYMSPLNPTSDHNILAI